MGQFSDRRLKFVSSNPIPKNLIKMSEEVKTDAPAEAVTAEDLKGQKRSLEEEEGEEDLDEEAEGEEGEEEEDGEGEEEEDEEDYFLNRSMHRSSNRARVIVELKSMPS